MTPDLPALRQLASHRRSPTDSGGTYSTSPEFDDLANLMGYESACAYIRAASPSMVLALLDRLEKAEAVLATAKEVADSCERAFAKFLSSCSSAAGEGDA